LEQHVLQCDRCGDTVQALKAEDTLAAVMGRARPTAAQGPEGEVVGNLIGRLEELRPSVAAPASATPTATVGLGDTPSVERSTGAIPPQASQIADAVTLPPQAPPAAAATAAMYDFLAPPRGPQELGRLGPYRVLKVLGAGGMGVVFQAEDPHLDRLVALKAMLPALAANPLARQRFLREAKAAAAIEHDHIIHINKVGEERGVPFLAMPLLKGEPLDERLKREGKLPVTEVLRIGREVAEGLAAAHEHGLIHRDIKPGNIWLEGSRARVKILDFGLARAAADTAHLTQSGAIVGTPAYMAPEQSRGGAVDHRADLFSLGCVLYRMATGEQPFKGTDTISILAALALDTPTPPGELDPNIPAGLSDLVMQLLAKDAAGRPATAKAVADVLGGIAGEGSMLLTRTSVADHKTVSRKPAYLWLLSRLGATLWSLRPWAFRRPGLAFAVEGVALVFVLLLISLPFMTSKKTPQVVTSRERQRPEDTDPAKSVTHSLNMTFVLIRAGKFTMGSSLQEIDRCLKLVGNGWEKDRLPTEGPEHEVEITRPFYMGATEVTVGQFRQFVTEQNYHVGDDRWQQTRFEQTDAHPVVFVTWQNAVDFCIWLSQKEGKKYRLPTEAEWEYSCRAGTKTRYSYGDQETELLRYAWINANSQSRTHPVGGLEKNSWGLFDMHGNVWEWCQDVYDANYYKTSPKKDPPGPSAGGERVVRGGSWPDWPVDCRSAFRHHFDLGYSHDHLGFRVVLVSSPGGDGP
jgi:formylglycine-generating enzyme required for sulfatase activity